jgi:hypothetical protein
MSDTRQRRIDVLKDAARRKSEDKTKAAQAALKRLIKRGEPITFQAVQREAGVSHAFLYNNQQLRAQIEHQRRQRRPALNPASADPDGQNNIVVTLTAEIARVKTQRQDPQRTGGTSACGGRTAVGTPPARPNRHPSTTHGGCGSSGPPTHPPRGVPVLRPLDLRHRAARGALRPRIAEPNPPLVHHIRGCVPA